MQTLDNVDMHEVAGLRASEGARRPPTKARNRTWHSVARA